MKKSILTAIAAVAAISGAVGYHSQQNHESQLSAVEMANLEALTDTEGWGYVDYDIACTPVGNGCIATPSIWNPDLGGISQFNN